MNSSFQSYRLLACGEGRKIERFGELTFDRPCSQAIWRMPRHSFPITSTFERKTSDKGVWQGKDTHGFKWTVSFFGLNLALEKTPFGHVGLFPEHLMFFEDRLSKLFLAKGRDIRVLHLFAYTGPLSLKMASLGAQVTHVDSSKAALAWAKRNFELNKALINTTIRWIEEDAQKFVARELRRESKYDFIVLDPPSFGRGTKNEIWKTEEHLLNLLEGLAGLRSDSFKGILLTSHSAGHSPKQLGALLSSVFSSGLKGQTRDFELEIPAEKGPSLPSGFAALYLSEQVKEFYI